MNMAGQCRPSPIYKEVTLKGGIHAGTYKDVGGVSTMEECQKKCCEFPACDLAFTLASSCYLVGCADHKSCELMPAKKSSFHPSVSYVTRWNSEGVKHTGTCLFYSHMNDIKNRIAYSILSVACFDENDIEQICFWQSGPSK